MTSVAKINNCLINLTEKPCSALDENNPVDAAPVSLAERWTEKALGLRVVKAWTLESQTICEGAYRKHLVA